MLIAEQPSSSTSRDCNKIHGLKALARCDFIQFLFGGDEGLELGEKT